MPTWIKVIETTFENKFQQTGMACVGEFFCRLGGKKILLYVELGVLLCWQRNGLCC